MATDKTSIKRVKEHKSVNYANEGMGSSFFTSQSLVKKKLLPSLFNTWELSQYPNQLMVALERVEKHEFIKSELHKMKPIKKNSDAIDMVLGKQKGKKSWYGRTGLYQLPTFELDNINNYNNYDVQVD
jgi:hypothetical protein